MTSHVISGATHVAGALMQIQNAVESDQGLTLEKLVANIPHDASAIVVYVMLLGSALLVWRAGRSRTRPSTHTEPPHQVGG